MNINDVCQQLILEDIEGTGSGQFEINVPSMPSSGMLRRMALLRTEVSE
jgi:hypothetical protein